MRQILPFKKEIAIMKTLLVLALLSLSISANAVEGALVCSGTGITSDAFLIQTRDGLDLMLKHHSDGSKSYFSLRGKSEDRWTSYQSRGEVIHFNYGDESPQGTYSLNVPAVPGKGFLELYWIQVSEKVTVDCSRNPSR